MSEEPIPTREAPPCPIHRKRMRLTGQSATQETFQCSEQTRAGQCTCEITYPIKSPDTEL